MVFTEKFSDFPVGGDQVSTDINVGLRDASNYQFNANAANGNVIQVIVQDTSGLTLGDVVRVMFVSSGNPGLYVPALGDSAGDAEVIGVVISIPSPTSFLCQQEGYLPNANVVFSGITLVAASPYFLSTTTPGALMASDATVNNTVSRPIFVADSPNSGWIVPYRGAIVGGAGPMSGGGMGFGLFWNTITVGGTVQMSPFNGYIINNPADLTTLILPPIFNPGDLIIVYNANNGGYQITQNANQYIQFSNVATTAGPGGSISSTSIGDGLMLLGLIPTISMGILGPSGNQVVV